MARAVSLGRGAVWWTAVPELGRRPTLVVSRDVLNSVLGEVTVARITAIERPRALPTDVALEPGEVDGLSERSFVLCHNLHTVPKSALEREAGELSPTRMLDVDDALRYALDVEV